MDFFHFFFIFIKQMLDHNKFNHDHINEREKKSFFCIVSLKSSAK